MFESLPDELVLKRFQEISLWANIAPRQTRKDLIPVWQEGLHNASPYIRREIERELRKLVECGCTEYRPLIESPR